MKTDPQAIHRYLSETRDFAIQLMGNAAYIQKELPSLEITDDLRTILDNLCDELLGTKHDLMHELFEIDPLLTTDPDASQIQGRIHILRQWTAESVGSIHHIMSKIQEAVVQGSATPLVGMLVMESSVNILNAVPVFPDMGEEPEEVAT